MSDNKKKILGNLEGDLVLCTGDMAINLYNKGYFGLPTRDGVELNGFEALHLYELKRIQVFHMNKELNAKDLLIHFAERTEDFMLRYLVYKDLRNRGYIVNVGSGSAFFFRLYNRDSKPKQGGAKNYVKPLKEGGSINLTELESLTELASHSDKDLIFGMVDAIGDVSYLKVEELYPERIENKEK